ncbi:MAG: ABC transporter permease [Phycisphaeraceae bacterium]|nr:MAG: ABC transporter permease [Phycisphaeraceae bacterium]
MSFLLETFRLGLSNLRLHLLRTTLTALGIILGVGAVIIMVSLGEGSKQAALVQIERLGARNIIIRSQRPPEEQRQASGQRRGWINRYGLTRDDLAVIEANFPDCAIVPLKEVGNQTARGPVRKTSQAFGTTPLLPTAANLTVARGRYFSDTEMGENAMVAVIGDQLARQYFRSDDPLGQTLRIDEKVFTIIGVLAPVGLAGGAGASLVGRDLDLDMHIPITTARAIFGDNVFRASSGSFNASNVQVSEVYLVSPSLDRVMTDAARVERILEARRPGANDVAIKVPYELLANAEKTARTYKLVFGFVAGIALLVGGIGIMNIMLASVTERTREIGIRRALGATKKHVLLQFLVECSVISILGGLTGVALGVGGSVFLDWGLPKLPSLPLVGRYFPEDLSMPATVTLSSIILAFSVAFITGLVFGIYPARRAAAQDPIVALRHE